MDNYLPYTPNKNQKGFRLLLLELQNHYVLSPKWKICRIQFCNDDVENAVTIKEKPYSTVIIGANGIGKSFILGAVAEIFRHIKRLKEEGQSSNQLGFRFAIQYFLNGRFYKISNIIEDSNHIVKSQNIEERYSCFENNKPVGLHWCKLPTAVLASSITINDRFKTQKQTDGFYWYLGTRNDNSPNTTGTRTIVRKTVAAVAECLTHDAYFREKLLVLLEKLDLEQKMEIQYSIRYKKIFLVENMTEEQFVRIFDDWENVYKEAGSKRASIPWGHKRFPTIRKQSENIYIMVGFLNRIMDENRVVDGNHLVYSIQEDYLKEDWKAIQLLSELDILSYPQIRVHKKVGENGDTSEFPFEGSSSGETTMLCQFINILSRIEHHCVVLIDEPETSSHPNWQIKYINWLNEIFERFHTCHFIISTHSHFLLSDLEDGTSAIVALTRNEKNGEIVNVGSKLNTFSWSVDDILYRVFGVRNTRNHAFENEIMALYKMMSDGSKDYNKIRSMTNRLEKVILPGNDPLLEILNQARKYVENR